MRNNKKIILKISVLIIGFASFIFPRFFEETDLIYVSSPWVYFTCFLYFTRTIKKKREWGLFILILLSAYEIRYRFFLGDGSGILKVASILLLLVVTLSALAPYIIDKIYMRCGGPFFLFIFPFMRLLAEKLLQEKMFDVAVTQFGNKWLIQSEAFLGDSFITFFVTFLPSLIVFIILKRKERKMIITGVILLSASVLGLIPGMIRYTFSPKSDNFVKMAYASGPQKTYHENPSEVDVGYKENVEYLKRTVEEAAEENAEMIVYAEEAFIISFEEEDRIIAEARKLAKDNHIHILLSLDSMDENDNALNKALLINNDGNICSEYTKTYLIPVMEEGEYVAGTGHIPVNHILLGDKEVSLSYTICYDTTVSDFLLTMDESTDILISPSWDWDEIDDLNYRLQGNSAVKCGVTLFKPTVDGWSIVTDPYGRLYYKYNTLGEDYNDVHFVDVPSGRTSTVYRKINNIVNPAWMILMWITVVEFLRAVVMSIIFRIKSKKGHAG